MAHFYYADARAPKAHYPKINTRSLPTPMFVYIYCGKGKVICSSDVRLVSTTIPNWYRSIKHTDLDGDGSVILKVSDPSKGQVTTDIDFTAGRDDTVNTSLKAGISAPRTVKVDLDDTISDSWMYHNPQAGATTPKSPLFDVDFIEGGAGVAGGINVDWAGHGETGNVVDSLPSHKENDRLSW